jgi:hypothetical protein
VNDSSSGDAALPTTPGTSRVTASIDGRRGHLAAEQHVVTDRDLVGRGELVDPLVDALVATAQQHEALLAGELSGASAWVSGRPRGVSSTVRGRGPAGDVACGRRGLGPPGVAAGGRSFHTASQALSQTSARMTMPAPPP